MIMKTKFPRSRWFGSSLAIAVCLLAIFNTVKAQTVADGATPLGLSPGAPSGSYSLSDFDSVNLFNGSLNVHLPLVKIAGRGGAGYTMSARIEQKWLVDREFQGVGQPNLFTPNPNWWNIEGFVPYYSAGRLEVRQAGSYEYSILGSCGYVHNQTLTRLTFTTPDGTEFELRDQLTNGQPKQPTSCDPGFNRGKVFATSDGSSAIFTSDADIKDYNYDNPANIPPSGDLITRDGTHYRIDGGSVSWMRDRNGNKITFTYASDFSHRVTGITDSLNRQVTISYATSVGSYDLIALKGFGGAPRTLKVYQSSLHDALRSDFSQLNLSQLFPELNGAYATPNNPPVISAVELPNGQSYHFYYNSYGELARVVLPTGGAIEYDYAAGLTDGAASGVIVIPNNFKSVYRRVIERRVYPDGATGTSFASRMTYSRPETTTSNAGYVVTDGYDASGTLLNRSIHYFYGSARSSFNQQPTEYPGWEDGREYQTSVYAANGTTELRRVTSTFAQRAAVSWWTGSSAAEPPNDPRLTETDTTVVDTNQVSKQTFGYDDSVPFNNQNNVKEYDLGSGSAGSLVRETRTTFVTSSSYTDLGLLSLPSQVSIYDGGGVERARTTVEYDNYTADSTHAGLVGRSGISGFDSSFGTSYGTRGNATATTKYLLSSSGSITSYAQYDIAGNAVKAIDARGNAVTIDFTDRFGAPNGEAESNSGATELAGQSSYAFPTQVTKGGLTTFTQFDYYLGRPVDSEDANGITSSGYYDDALDRPTQMIRAVNGGVNTKSQATFSYDDTNHIITTTSDQTTYGDNALKSQVLYDGLGRATEKRQYEGGTNYIAAQTQYDALGRAYKSSNPFRPWQSESAIWTTSAFDAIGRVTSVTTPDTAVVNTSYSGNAVTVTDQHDTTTTGHSRTSVTDGLGRLIQIYEDPSSLNYLTSYSYDTLDNLTSVSQGTQTRTFSYDSLKRLLSATNPESGTICYGTVVSSVCQTNGYDGNGNLLYKTDARGVLTTYAYDALNRVTSRTYSDSTPTVTYAYDPNIANGKGRLSSVSSSVSSYSYGSYDTLGRVLTAKQTISSHDYSMSYSYDLANHVISMTYPSGHTVTNDYDSAGRLQDFTGTIGDGFFRTYASSITYASIGGLQQEQFGTATAVYNKLTYNSRGQLSEIRAATSGNDTTFNRGKIVNDYGTNGNLKQQTTYVPNSDTNDSPTSWYQQYSYDALNRLTQVHEYTGSTSLWQQTFGYDRYGNRTIDYSNTTSSIPRPQFTVDTSNNRLTVPSGQSGTMTYDNAGNLTVDTYSGTAVSRAYDAENRMTSETTYSSVVAGSYSYDGDGHRVKRVVSGTETWQVYGVGGELIAEYSASGDPLYPQKEYGYRNGQLLITAESGVALGVAPTSLAETSAGSTSITLNWGATTGATNYVIERKQASTGYAYVANTSSTSWTNSVSAGSAYLYRVCAANSSNVCTSSYSNIALGVAVSFTDDPLYGLSEVSDPNSATTIKAAHINELRAAINAVRALAIVGNASYSHPDPTPQVSVVYVEDVRELRTALNEAMTVLHLDVEPFTDPTLVGVHEDAAHATPVKAVHIRELREHLKGTIGSSCYKSIDQFVKDFYQGVLKRQPSSSELSSATSTLQSAQATSSSALITAAQNLGSSLFGSSEYASLGTSDDQFITDQYNGYLQRTEDTSGHNFWLSYLHTPPHTRADVIANFAGSVEFTENAKALCRTAGGGSTTGSVHWMISDQLGTPRMIVDASGSLSSVSRHDYLPFGEELGAGVGGRTPQQGYSASDVIRQKFTDKERDAETGLDYFGARYFGSSQGRFISPDPLLSSSRSLQPQSWNKYSYVINRPLSLVDPNGLDWGQWDDGKKTHYHWFDGKIGKYNGHAYSAVPELAKGGSSLSFTDSNGLNVTLRNDPRHYYTAIGGGAPQPVVNPAQDQLNQLGGALAGVGHALVSVNPILHPVVDWAVHQTIGGVEEDSGYHNAANITGALTITAATAAAPLAEPGNLFHYTSAPIDSVLENGLRTGSTGEVFTTTAGDLTAAEAQSQLALDPSRGLPTKVFEIDRHTLESLGIKVPPSGTVGPMHGMPGSGTEVIFNQAIPAEAIHGVRHLGP